MTYDVQRYCLCWICEAMVKWNEPCHEERVTNASYGEWVIAADAEAHEKAAVEAAVLRLTKAFMDQLHGDEDDVRAALEASYRAGQRDMLATAIAKVEAAPQTFWAEAQDADELGWLQQHELYVAALRALLDNQDNI